MIYVEIYCHALLKDVQYDACVERLRKCDVYCQLASGPVVQMS